MERLVGCIAYSTEFIISPALSVMGRQKDITILESLYIEFKTLTRSNLRWRHSFPQVLERCYLREQAYTYVFYYFLLRRDQRFQGSPSPSCSTGTSSSRQWGARLSKTPTIGTCFGVLFAPYTWEAVVPDMDLIGWHNANATNHPGP
jgi:hypothetical protein